MAESLLIGGDQAAALGGVLRMIRRDIDRAIAPEAHSALAKDTITSLTLILDELADYFAGGADPEVERSTHPAAARGRVIADLAAAELAALDRRKASMAGSDFLRLR